MTVDLKTPGDTEITDGTECKDYWRWGDKSLQKLNRSTEKLGSWEHRSGVLLQHSDARNTGVRELQPMEALRCRDQWRHVGSLRNTDL